MKCEYEPCVTVTDDGLLFIHTAYVGLTKGSNMGV